MTKILLFGIAILMGCANSTYQPQVPVIFNDYKYVMNAWVIDSKEYQDLQKDNLLFHRHFYETVNKNTSQDRLVYYIERPDFLTGFKLIIYLKPNQITSAELWQLQPDFKSCSPQQFKMADFRRQSCYIFKKNHWKEKENIPVSEIHSLLFQTLTTRP